MQSRKNVSLAIVGSLPPPFGGVSVSLSRLIPYLEAEKIDFVIYNTGNSYFIHDKVINIGWRILPLIFLLLFSRHKIVHFNTSRWYVRFFAAILRLLTRSRIIFTAHGYSIIESLQSGSYVKCKIARWSIMQASVIVATNQNILKRLCEHGFPKECIVSLPAYIPPAINSDDKLPESVKFFCKGKHPLLCANGAFTVLSGQDVYGLHALIELICKLRKTCLQIGLIVYLRKDSIKNNFQFSSLLKKIEAEGLGDNVLFYYSDEEFWPCLKICDVFLRPTSTDGDANSIREAIYFDVPVVASDVVPRLQTCNLYKFNDQDDLEKVTLEVLANLDNYKKKLIETKYNGAVELIRLYKSLLFDSV